MTRGSARPFRRATPLRAPVARPARCAHGDSSPAGARPQCRCAPRRSARCSASLGLVGAVVLREQPDHHRRHARPVRLPLGRGRGRLPGRPGRAARGRRCATTTASARLGVLGTGIAVVGRARRQRLRTRHRRRRRRGRRCRRRPVQRATTRWCSAPGPRVSSTSGSATSHRARHERGPTAWRSSGSPRFRCSTTERGRHRRGGDASAASGPSQRPTTVNHDVRRAVGTRPRRRGGDPRAPDRTVDSEVFVARLPSDLANLERVQPLPWALAAFLAVVARHGRGARGRQHGATGGAATSRSSARSASSTASCPRSCAGRDRRSPLIGLVLGIPLGLIAGRVVWMLVADGIGIDAVGRRAGAGTGHDRGGDGRGRAGAPPRCPLATRPACATPPPPSR